MNSDIVFLVTVYTSYEFCMVKGILDSNNIPYLVRDEGVAGFLRLSTGAILGGVHIFVNKIHLKKSKDLLVSIGFKLNKKEKKDEF